MNTIPPDSLSATSPRAIEECDADIMAVPRSGRDNLLYEKLYDCIIGTPHGTPVPVESLLWVSVLSSPHLSTVWVQHGDEPRLRCFGRDPCDYRMLMKTCSTDGVDMGCIFIDLVKKRSYAVDSRQTQNVSIRSGLHFIRNHARRSLGFVYFKRGPRFEISFLEASRNAIVFHPRRSLLQRLHESLLKNLVFAFDHVALFKGNGRDHVDTEGEE